MPFTWRELVFLFDATDPLHRERAVIKLCAVTVEVAKLDVITCGKTNVPPNPFDKNAELAVRFARREQLENLKSTLKTLLYHLDQAVDGPDMAPFFDTPEGRAELEKVRSSQ